MSDTSAANTSIQVISRMFSLLDTLAHEGDAVSLKAISEQTGLHPSTAHRILNDLAVGGMVERSGPGTYRLGLRLLQLGNQVRARLDVREQAAKPMQELHRQTGFQASLFIRQDDEAWCVERTASERSGIQVTRVMGQRVPLVSHPAGRLLLLNDNLVSLQNIAQAHGLRWEVLQTELNQLRQQGYSQESGQVDATQQLAAAPIHDDQGKVIASLALHATVLQQTPQTLDALKSSAQRISNHLGWHPN